jgi:hypothetical protein
MRLNLLYWTLMHPINLWGWIDSNTGGRREGNSVRESYVEFFSLGQSSMSWIYPGPMCIPLGPTTLPRNSTSYWNSSHFMGFNISPCSLNLSKTALKLARCPAKSFPRTRSNLRIAPKHHLLLYTDFLSSLEWLLGYVTHPPLMRESSTWCSEVWIGKLFCLS